ncbi:carboxyl transferase domain-containing protein, partial [Streptomyces baarnensis]|uniref:carboxyl transferase domain-containing protein n=1 Tax=Streptomyces baarnensis TaxID=66872 RepID=UPI002D21AE42
ADVHAGVSGVSHFAYDSEEECLEDVRHLLSLLPSNNRELAPVEQSGDPAERLNDRLLDLVPVQAGQAYDIRAVIEEIVDDGDHFEVHSAWAPNLVCSLARLDGHVVGTVANNPSAFAGVLDIEASEKGARFVQF